MTSRLCKYHGRACETPGYCLTNRPRKYEGDGHLETIDPERLTLGCVIRMVQSGGGQPTFSDNVIIGIQVQYSSARRKTETQDVRHFENLLEAREHATKDDYVLLILARPYLYADNRFGSMPNHLLGCEKYELFAHKLDAFKVVVLSSGEYCCYMSAPLLHSWEVRVNGEMVHDGMSKEAAKVAYTLHRQMAQGAFGCKGGQTVTLLRDGKKEDEYVGGM